MYRIVFASKAQKDKKLLKQAGLDRKAKALLTLMMENPFCNPPEYEKLSGSLRGFYSRRLNLKHRIVYEVDSEARVVKILSMWSHRGDN